MSPLSPLSLLLFAPFLLLLSTSCPLSVAGQTGATSSFLINGRVYTNAQVAQFAPIAFYHPAEHYFPLSIHSLTAASALLELNLTLPNPYVPILPVGQVTPATLGMPAYRVVSDDNASGSYFLNVSADAYPGTPLNTDGTVSAQVPMYFSVQQLTPDTVRHASNANDLVINFFFLYAHNGAQTIRYTVLDDTRLAIAHSLAMHQGDIETLLVVVDADMTAVRCVGGSAHGKTNFGSGQALLGMRPLVYVSLEGHALYTGTDVSFNPSAGYTGFTSLDAPVSVGDALAIDVIDLYGVGGARWAPTVASLHHIGLDAQGGSLHHSDSWVQFNGRLGFNYVTDVNTCEYLQCLGQCGPYHTLVNAGFQALACDVVPAEARSSNGPESFGRKDTAPPTVADVGNVELPTPGSQLLYQLPVESAHGLLLSYPPDMTTACRVTCTCTCSSARASPHGTARSARCV